MATGRESAGASGKVFLALGLGFGLLFVFLTPPFQAPDEWNHFFRAYQVSEGRLISERDKTGIAGGNVPVSLLITSISIFYDLPYTEKNRPELDALMKKGAVGDEEMNPFRPEGRDRRVKAILSLLKVPLEPEKKTFIYFFRTAAYTPLPYLPQAGGIALGRALGLSPLALIYMGRASNLLAWVLLVWLAIRAAPVLRWVFMLLALTPTSLFLASSLSVDALTNGLSFYLIAFLLALALDKGREVSPWELAKLFFLSVAFTATKYYIFIPCLFLLVPSKKTGGAGRKFVVFALLFALVSACFVGWSVFAKDYFVELDPGVSPERQLKHITSAPLNYARVVWDTLAANWLTYLKGAVGSLGHFDLYLPDRAIALHWAVLVFFSAVGGEKGKCISFGGRMLVLAIVALSIIPVVTSTYLAWTPVGKDIVSGLQGRYIIPFAPLMLVPLYVSRIRLGDRPTAVTLSLYCLALLSYTSFVILRGYYL